MTTHTSEQLIVESAAPQHVRSKLTLPAWLLALGRGFTLAGWLAVVLVFGVYGVTAGWGLGAVGDFLVTALAGFLFVFLFDGIATLIWKVLGGILPRLRLGRANDYLQAVPAAMVGRLIGILLLIFGDLLWPESIFKHVTLPLPGKFIVLGAAVGGGLFFIARLARRPARRYGGYALAAVPLVAVMAWLLLPGVDGYVTTAAPVAPGVATLEVANPGLPGPFAVRSLSYGSGDSERRAEFGAEAALITPTVDGSPIFAGYEGFAGAYYKWYNGFDFTRLPLNGLVWYPEGEGPFPLVLIVHGNHSMTEPSDPGYAYLGEHLASRGMIAVSVDQNFLNGFGFADGDMREMPQRAWLLLKHLEQWRGWNETAGNPFYGRVDLNRVGLIGHSRGGEAVAHAAEMNTNPIGAVADVADADDFGFGIRGVVALAPCDNRYKPRGGALRLDSADYLLLASGHDGDMYYLDGLGQYGRAGFGENPDGFKALAYLYRGNHGNFNTVWGDADQGAFESLLLNRKPLLMAEEQQQAAKVLITAFLEASLNERNEYRALFYKPGSAREWLPDDVIVTQYRDAGFIPLKTNGPGQREALDVRGGVATAEGLAEWRFMPQTLRDGETTAPNQGLLLGWTAGREPAFRLDLPPGMAAEWSLTPDHALSFMLANAAEEGLPGPVFVELTAGDAVVRLPLESFGPMQPVMPAQLVKASWVATTSGYDIETATAAERVAQTYDLPLSAFVAANPDFDPAALTTVRFLFDGAAEGQIVLDDIGFREP